MPESRDFGNLGDLPRPEGPDIEIDVKNTQSAPFQAKRQAGVWHLSVNRDHFLSKGFLPSEIDGAIYLETERLASQVSVGSLSEFNGLKHWQESAKDVREVSAYKNLFERISALKTLEKNDPAKAQAAWRYLRKIAFRAEAQDYPGQLLQTILQRSLGEEVMPPTKIVTNVLANLAKKERFEEREVSALDALSSPNLSYDAKTAWFENRFLPRLEFLQRQQEIQKSQEEPQEKEGQAPEDQEPPTPDNIQDEFEQHRGKETKGKAKPIFTIDPFHPGYWETDSYTNLDEKTGRFTKSDTIRSPITVANRQTEIVCTIKGRSGTNLFSLPLTMELTPDKESIIALQQREADVLEDPEGHVFIQSKTNQPYEIRLTREMFETRMHVEITQPFMKIVESKLPHDIAEKIEELKNLSLDSLGKVSLWQDFIRSYFKYPHDEQVTTMYANVDANPGHRLSAMAQGKLLDCHMAREFFLGGIKRLELPDLEWRAVNGHYLSTRQKDRTGHLNSGTGHAWVRARLIESGEWVIFDPTPPGDPVKKGEGAGSGFGDSKEELVSPEDLRELGEELGGSEKPKYIDPSEKYLLEFANSTGITPDEARRILNTLKEADQLKDRSGRNILERLKQQFNRIIQVYTKERIENLGNVEMSRGRELSEPVEAFVDIKTGALNPKGFSRQTLTEEKGEMYGGFDIEVIADGSGSMAEQVGGVIKYLAQQKMCYLLHRAAHYFADEARKRQLRLLTPLAVRSSQYMFRGKSSSQKEDTATVIKPLTPDFTPAQMVLLWKRSAENIGNGTPAHMGLQAVLDTISKEDAELLKNKKLLKIVALISDGGYDSPDAVQQLKKTLEDMNVIVAEFRISDGKSLEDLPANVAEKVIESARKLIPEKVRK